VEYLERELIGKAGQFLHKLQRLGAKLQDQLLGEMDELYRVHHLLQSFADLGGILVADESHSDLLVAKHVAPRPAGVGRTLAPGALVVPSAWCHSDPAL